MKNRIRYLILFVCIISLCSSSCREKKAYTKIYIKNNSDKTVYYDVSFSYPDTSLQNIVPFPGEDGRTVNKISSGDQDYTLAAIFAFNPTLQFFIFDADVIEHESKDSIIAHYKVLKRYQFKESDMERADWTITYP